MPKSTIICFHYPKEAEVAKIVELFRLDDRQAADVSRLLCDLVSSLRALEAARESFNTSAPRSQVLARLHRIQAALSEAAEELRGADQRTALLLTFACDYRDSTRQRNARIKTFLKDTLVLDSWRQLTPSDAPYQGPLELLHDLPEQSRARLARRGDETMLALIESMRQPIAQILEVDRRTRCGAPGKPHRNFAISCLACGFEPIFGRAPTPTPSGPFVLFCELCLEAIGLDTVGVEKAVQTVLRCTNRRQMDAAARNDQKPGNVNRHHNAGPNEATFAATGRRP